jgi:phosphoribosyl 1,2-cyclic phosphate phosphodiesterase
VEQPKDITVTFLGTGTSSGVPMIGCSCKVCKSSDDKDKRLRSSILIQSPTTTLVIDTTPDFRYQMLRAKVSQLDAAVFTHPHKDHIGGLDDIRAFNFLQQKTMPLYANALTEKGIRNDFYYAFEKKTYPGIPQLNFVNIDSDSFKIGDITLLPIACMHLKMPVLGFRINDFAYITDANFIADEELLKLQGIHTLVINILRKEKHLSHYNLAEALTIGERLKVRQLYGTHISHQLGNHTVICNEMPTWATLAYDNLKINI